MEEDIAVVALSVLGCPNLTDREKKYIIWRFGNNKTMREIANLEGRKMSRQIVNYVIQKGLKKIRILCGETTPV